MSNKLAGVVGISFLLIIAGLWAYHNSFSGPFIFDDVPSILENPNVHRLWPIWDAMHAPKDSPVGGRPIVSLSLAINYALGGAKVWGYHFVNLITHIFVSLVFFAVLRRTFLTKPLEERFGRNALYLAGTISLIWTVHPLLTESVDYVIQRSELFMGLCLMLTLYCVVRSIGSTSSGWWSTAAVSSCAIGMASKEVMVFAPLLVLLYDRAFFSGSLKETFRLRSRLYIGLAASYLVLAACFISSTHTGSVGFGFPGLALLDYARTQCAVISRYLKLAFWPHHLVLDYDDWPIARSIIDVWPSALLLIALAAATLRALYLRSPVGFLGAWFFLILGPTSSLLPISTEVAAERRMYMPLCAVTALMVLCAWRLLQNIIQREVPRRYVAAGLVTATVLTLSLLTIDRNRVYASALAIWADTVAKRPNNARAHYNLGVALGEERMSREAFRHLSEALRLNLAYARAHIELGAVLAQEGKLEEAVSQLTEALRLVPNSATAHNTLGVILSQEGKLKEAASHYTEALRLMPEFSEAHHNLADILRQEGKLKEAASHYTEALQLRPDSAKTYNNLGVVMGEQGNFSQAISYFRKALKLKPDYAQAKANLNLALSLQK